MKKMYKKNYLLFFVQAILQKIRYLPPYHFDKGLAQFFVKMYKTVLIYAVWIDMLG